MATLVYNEFAYNLLGYSTELLIMQADEAIGLGDVVVPGEQIADNEYCSRMDDNAEKALGVALDAAGAALEWVSIMTATPWNVFIFTCAADKKYVEADDRFTACDFNSWVTTLMTIDPVTDATSMIHMLKLADSSLWTIAATPLANADNIVGNRVEGIFKQRAYVP